MKKLTLFYFLSMACLFANAQDDEETASSQEETIQTLMNEPSHFGFFGNFLLRGSQLHNEPLIMASFRGGVIVNRMVAFGIDVNGIIPSTEYNQLYFNEEVIPLGGYGGFFVEPIFLSNKVLHFTLPVSAGAGWLGYHYNWDNNRYNENTDLLEDDVFWYVEPGVQAELNISRLVRLHFGVTYRFIQDLNLQSTSNSDFSGMAYNIGIKVGRF